MCCKTLVLAVYMSKFFPIHKRDQKLGYLTRLGCTTKFTSLLSKKLCLDLPAGKKSLLGMWVLSAKISENHSTFKSKLSFNPNKAWLFEGSFLWGEGQFGTPPPSYFKKNLSNINITLYNCQIEPPPLPSKSPALLGLRYGV